MTNKELSIVLRELACNQPTPLCEKWTDEWKDDAGIDDLLAKYVRGFDFCVKNDYPPLPFIRKHFKKEDLHRHDIYIDEKIDIKDADSGIYIFLGKCSGTITFKGFKAATIYTRHYSVIQVRALDCARCFVTEYDSSHAATYSDSVSKVRLYDKRKKEG